MSRIFPNDEFRNPRTSRIDEPIVDGFRNIRHISRGRHQTPGDFGKGMPRYAKLKEGPRKGVIPATWFHSKKGGKEYPDEIDAHAGYVMYYGDNGWKESDGEKRPPHPSAEDSYGIKMLNQVEHLYFSEDREDREIAPPILITEGFTRSSQKMRRFVGVGVLIGRETVSIEGGEYENILYHVGLLDLSEGLDWTWIDDLRDSSLTIEETFTNSPSSWRKWVEKGHEALSSSSIEKSIDTGKVKRLPKRPDPLTLAEEREPDDGTGYVYAITNPAWGGWVKIGRARDAEKRLGDYLTYSPKRDYDLEYAVFCEDRISAEAAAHRHAARLAFGKKRGEWFSISLNQAKLVLDQLGEPGEEFSSPTIDEDTEWLSKALNDPNY